MSLRKRESKKLAESLTQKNGSRREERFVGEKNNPITRSTICVRDAVSVTGEL